MSKKIVYRCRVEYKTWSLLNGDSTDYVEGVVIYNKSKFLFWDNNYYSIKIFDTSKYYNDPTFDGEYSTNKSKESAIKKLSALLNKKLIELESGFQERSNP